LAVRLPINRSAMVAVTGMKRLLKHPRLIRRVVASFSALEVSLKNSRTEPCAHIHTLIVTRSIDKGRHRISEADWVTMWEESCSLARTRDPGKMMRKTSQPKPNLSLVAKFVPHGESVQLSKVISYVTKLATPANLADYFRPLIATPDEYIARMDALVGVTRYFGPLHRRRSKPASPSADRGNAAGVELTS
jgi:hypothetical protein